jgi:hypothetical protein
LGQAPKNVLSNLGVSESMLEERQAEHLLLEPIRGASGLDGFERLNLTLGDGGFAGHRSSFPQVPHGSGGLFGRSGIGW